MVKERMDLLELVNCLLNQRACLIRTQMDLPETDVAANSLAMGVMGIGQAGQPVSSGVGGYRASTVCPLRHG